MDLEVKEEVLGLPSSPTSLNGCFMEPEGCFESEKRVSVDAEIVKCEEIAASAGLSSREKVRDCYVLLPKMEYGEYYSGHRATYLKDNKDQNEITGEDNHVEVEEEETSDNEGVVMTRAGRVARRSTRKDAVQLGRREPEPQPQPQRSPQEVKEPHDGSILCLICDCKSKPWAKKWDGSVHLLESFCKVLELPSNDQFEDEVKRSCYCFICQRRVIELVSLAEEVERLQNRIVEIKTEMKCKMEKCLEVPVAKKRKKNANAAQESKAVSLRKIIIDGIKKENLKRRTSFRRIDSDNESDDNSVQSQSPFHDVNYDEPNKGDNVSDSDAAFDCPMEFETDNDSDFEPATSKSKTRRKSRKRRKSTDFCDIMKDKEQHTGTVDNDTIPPPKPRKKVPKSDPKRPVKCDECGRGFEDEIRRDAHVKRFHEGVERSYCCDFDGCTKSFKALCRLISHQRIHTGETPFMCELCGKGFRQTEFLIIHQQSQHHPESMKFKCDQCDKTFRWMSYLTTHKMSHTKKYPFTCESCGKGFTSNSFLREHIRINHSEKNPYTCDFENCGKSFAAKVNLTDHKFIHTQDYPIHCSECGLGFTAESKLRRHMKRKHLKTDVFECDICQKRFNYKESIKKHKMTHTGERPHICETCGKGFIDQSKLSRHQLIHTGEKAFACDLCDKTFYTKDYLKTHVTSHHNKVRNGNEKVEKNSNGPDEPANAQRIRRSKTKRRSCPTSSTENTSEEERG